MDLGSTQPLTEMSTRNLPGGKEWPAGEADNLTTICEPIVYKMWDPRRLTTLWAFTACYGIALPFYPDFIVLIICIVTNSIALGLDKLAVTRSRNSLSCLQQSDLPSLSQVYPLHTFTSYLFDPFY
jgi:hypothetical protein